METRQTEQEWMIAVSMAILQHVISFHASRAVVRPSSRLALSLCSRRQLSVSPSSRPPQVDRNVLLGMSEQELQKLAIDLGQESYRGKQLHHLIYKRKVRGIENFVQLPQAFRNDLQEAGWTVGRLPIYRAVTAADGTVKLLIKLEDNRLIETVGIQAGDKKGSMRLTACVCLCQFSFTLEEYVCWLSRNDFLCLSGLM